jgi:hypothetical protein
MGLLDFVVDKSFRDEKDGRVVVFPGDHHNRGYVVRSESDEVKIRSFLKLFYFARSSVALLGLWLAIEWSKDVNYALGRPAEHLLRTLSIFAGMCSLVMLFPYLLLWRTYKKALLSFVSVHDEILVSGKSAAGRRWGVVAGLATLVLATLALLVFHWIRIK